MLWGHARHGGQRRRTCGGRLLHRCCICGQLDVWGENWSAYYSIKELDDGVPIPKFCSHECRQAGGPAARNVTEKMKQMAKNAEWCEKKKGRAG
jgi:hypothetical protein